MKWMRQYNYLPPGPMLKKSFKFRAKEFLLENTLHGVKYFVDASRPMWERLLWFILVTLSIGVTIGIIVSIWDKFQTDPTLTGLDTETEELEIEFPQVFLCFDWSELNRTLLNDKDEELYSRVYNWRWGKRIDIHDLQFEDRKNFRDTFKKMIPHCSGMFTDCVYGGKELDCAKELIEIMTPAGGCCKFNATEPFTIQTHPTEFSFVPTTYNFGLYLILKEDLVPGTIDQPIVRLQVPTSVKIEPIITYTTADLRYLTEHQRQCHYLSQGRTFRHCRDNCLKDAIKKKCGCLPWIMASSRDEECPLSKYPCIQSNITMDCKCTILCDNTVYTCKKIQENPIPKSQKCSVGMSTWPRARYRREIRFGYLDLVVSFGGLGGLFLGYSLLTTVELIYYFTLRLYCGAVLDSSQRKHNIVTVHVIAPKNPPQKASAVPKYFDYTE